MAKADLQKIAETINQAQGVYKQLVAKRNELSKAVEALKLMNEWQVRTAHDLYMQARVAKPSALHRHQFILLHRWHLLPYLLHRTFSRWGAVPFAWCITDPALTRQNLEPLQMPIEACAGAGETWPHKNHVLSAAACARRPATACHACSGPMAETPLILRVDRCAKHQAAC